MGNNFKLSYPTWNPYIKIILFVYTVYAVYICYALYVPQPVHAAQSKSSAARLNGWICLANQLVLFTSFNQNYDYQAMHLYYLY